MVFKFLWSLWLSLLSCRSLCPLSAFQWRGERKALHHKSSACLGHTPPSSEPGQRDSCGQNPGMSWIPSWKPKNVCLFILQLHLKFLSSKAFSLSHLTFSGLQEVVKYLAPGFCSSQLSCPWQKNFHFLSQTDCICYSIFCFIPALEVYQHVCS